MKEFCNTQLLTSCIGYLIKQMWLYVRCNIKPCKESGVDFKSTVLSSYFTTGRMLLSAMPSLFTFIKLSLNIPGAHQGFTAGSDTPGRRS